MNSDVVPFEATPIRPPAIVSPTIITTIENCAAPIMKRLNALMARPPEADVGCLVLSELTTGATVSSKVLLPEVPYHTTCVILECRSERDVLRHTKHRITCKLRC